jgi:hypothetical protein
MPEKTSFLYGKLKRKLVFCQKGKLYELNQQLRRRVNSEVHPKVYEVPRAKLDTDRLSRRKLEKYTIFQTGCITFTA